ncbi:hypothetical protein HGRIS_007682 [Hohenbuehelia grisea]|uniref:Transmembrane protein n=1 Tax=Hohenbuehelia grisea TaxID=104357 RepID=A0ABR3J5K9_9AGAR
MFRLSFFIGAVILYVLTFLTSISAGLDLVIPLFDPSLSLSPSSWISSPPVGPTDFVFTDRDGLQLNASLPAGTTRFRYVGFRQASNSLYGICINSCSASPGMLKFSGTDPALRSGTQSSTPVVLFEMMSNPASRQNILVFNFADPGAPSRITFLRLDVTIADTVPATTASSSSTTVPTGTDLPLQAKKTLSSTLATTIAVLVAIVVISVAAGLVLCFLRRRGKVEPQALSPDVEAGQSPIGPKVTITTDEQYFRPRAPRALVLSSSQKALPALPPSTAVLSAEQALQRDEQLNTSSHQSFLSMTSSSNYNHDPP